MSVTGSAVDFLGESMRASPVETATEPPSREERKGVKQVEELAQILDIPLLPSSNLRTPSFVECVSAARRRRARSLPALPSSGESSAWQSQHPQQSGEEALPIIPSSRHATPATSPPRESGGGRTRASLLEKKAIDPLIDGEYGDSLVINDEDEVATLRELLRHKEEDLRMAAMIGQRLLDKQEELAADLESTREKKWMAECESESLRRDLAHAAQRCEQMQRDTHRVDTVYDQDQFDLQSPATLADTATPASPAGGSSSLAYSAMATGDEARRLGEVIESLKHANVALKDQLVEAHLETNALRRASVENQGLLRIDQDAGGFLQHEREDQPRYLRDISSASDASDQGLPTTDALSDTAKDGALIVTKTREIGTSTDLTQRDVDESCNKTPAAGRPHFKEAEDGSSEAERTEKHRHRSFPREASFFSKSQGSVARPPPGREHRENNNPVETSGAASATVTPSPSSCRRRLSGYESTDEQAELIESLREQIAHYRLEAERATVLPVSAPEASRRTGVQSHDGAVRGQCAKGWSDDDSSIGDGAGRIPSNSGAFSNTGRGDETDSEGRGRGGGDVVGEALTAKLLRARVSELSSELATVSDKLATHRMQARANQSLIAGLRTELASLRLSAQRNVVGEAGAARDSPTTLRSGSRYGAGGYCGNPCPDNGGLGWLRWLWNKFRGLPDGEGAVRRGGVRETPQGRRERGCGEGGSGFLFEPDEEKKSMLDEERKSVNLS